MTLAAMSTWPIGNNPRGPDDDPQAFADRVAQEEKADHDHLRGGLGFARGIGGEDRAVRKGELTQSGDEKVARIKDDGSPCRDVVRPREAGRVRQL